jgi:hypothetical protein
MLDHWAVLVFQLMEAATVVPSEELASAHRPPPRWQHPPPPCPPSAAMAARPPSTAMARVCHKLTAGEAWSHRPWDLPLPLGMGSTLPSPTRDVREGLCFWTVQFWPFIPRTDNPPAIIKTPKHPIYLRHKFPRSRHVRKIYSAYKRVSNTRSQTGPKTQTRLFFSFLLITLYFVHAKHHTAPRSLTMCMRVRGIRVNARPVSPANSVDEARPACSFLGVVAGSVTASTCCRLFHSLARSNCYLILYASVPKN